MHERLKYVTARPSLANPKRWYWQRPGHDLVRLPDDPVLRFAKVQQLNQKTDGQSELIHGSVGWVVDQYRQSDDYAILSPGTLKYYDRFLNDIECMVRNLPFKDTMTRRVAVDFVRRYKKSMQRQAAAVLVNLYNTAVYHQVAEINHALKMRIKGGKPRETAYDDQQIKAWMDACEDDDMRLAFTILRYAVQRPGDVLAMRWDQYDGDIIKLRQQKTGKLISVPCHTDLKAALNEAKKATKSVFIVSRGFRRLSYTRFSVRFRNITDAAGLPDHQARDLRRTAAVRMSEAGATVQQIAAIAGWSIDYTQRIVETYIPRNIEMARGAVKKWERKKKKV